jgi:general stress protein CsbA
VTGNAPAFSKWLPLLCKASYNIQFPPRQFSIKINISSTTAGSVIFLIEYLSRQFSIKINVSSTTAGSVVFII